MNKDLILIAKFGKPHGIKGNIKLYSFSDDPFKYPFLVDKDENKFFIKLLSQKENFYIINFNDNNSRDLAEELGGLELFTYRSMLPNLGEDEFYHNDLIGMEVFDDNRNHKGNVVAVYNFGAGDIIEIMLVKTQKKEMFPFHQDFIESIDINQKKIIYKFF